MPATKNRRIRLIVLQEDAAVVNGVRGMGDYAPSNPNCTVEKLNAATASLAEKQAAAQSARSAATATLDAAIAEEWAFHKLIKDVKNQVRAQYGLNSDEVQAIGLKKEIKRKAPARQPKRANGNGAGGTDTNDKSGG